jgi:hypothetical protein
MELYANTSIFEEHTASNISMVLATLILGSWIQILLKAYIFVLNLLYCALLWSACIELIPMQGVLSNFEPIHNFRSNF